VVLVHGSMDRGAGFARVVPLLGDRVVVRYDRRGYAGSVDHGPPATVDEHAADLLEVIDAHASGAAVVVGHSIGGVVALVAATRRPAAVVAVGAYEAPMPWLPSWEGVSAGGDAVAVAEAEGAGAAAERFLRRMIGDDRWEALPEADRARRRAEGPALVAELRSVRAGGGPPYDLDAVRGTIRAACGTGSRPHHRAAAAELARLVGDELTEIEGARHRAHATHPEAFAAWVRTLA
jgi:pimeloyl-ACP methyl ester carboxylesterase